MFQTPLSIRQVLEGINRNYYLPAIQREFVWKEEQILNLVDSILQGYPFGSFLVWKVKGQNVSNFEFYEFLRNYHQAHKVHNDKASLNGVQVIDAILDGQQRLTSLHIAFKGTYATKIPYRRWEDPTAFPERRLYLNLLKCSEEQDDVERRYLLEFKDPLELEGDTEWFEIGKILSMNIGDVLSYVQKRSLPTDPALMILSNLFQRVNDSTINYYLEESDELHKVLNIFVRVNSGGTTLSYSDLLLSIATAGFERLDARQEIHGAVDEINNIGAGFNINKDFILKTCLFLLDKDVKFSIDNFDIETMRQIELAWPKIKQSIFHAFTIAYALGMNSSVLSSNYPIAIVSYFLYKNNITANDVIHKIEYLETKSLIQKFIYVTLIKQTFSGSLDATLVQMRKAVSGMESFDLEVINAQMSINKKFDFSPDDIDQLLDYGYGHRVAFMLLAFLYPNKDLNNIFHVDHVFPKSKFNKQNLLANGVLDEDVAKYVDMFNLLPNLQLLEGPVNLDKLDALPEDWMLAKYKSPEAIESYKRENYMDIDMQIDYSGFGAYYDARKKSMKDALFGILS